MSTPKVETLFGGLTLGEGPHWDVTTQSLYFTDMPEQKVHRYVPSTNRHTVASAGYYTSVIIPVKGQKDQFLLTLENKIATATWDGESPQISNVKILQEVDVGTKNVFNDGKCDATGTFWAGTMGNPAKNIGEDLTETIPDEKGTLYSFQRQNLKSHRYKIGISNGIAFNNHLRKMYYVDSYRRTVDQYDIDFKTATLSNLKQVFSIEKHPELNPGVFDGMTIDTDGNLWIAVFNGSRVVQIDPRKPETLLQTIKIPTACVTSVTFGGENLDELYVTSAGFPAYGSSEGFLYKITGTGAKGLPADEFVL